MTEVPKVGDFIVLSTRPLERTQILEVGVSTVRTNHEMPSLRNIRFYQLLPTAEFGTWRVML